MDTTATARTVLVECKELSARNAYLPAQDSYFENRIIRGDNLDILQTLRPEFERKIKCIYIDPPYNTKNHIPHYEDARGHQSWVGNLKTRLKLLWSLLTEDGFLIVQIDDNEFARLYLLMADLLGEARLKTICVKMAEPTGFKMIHALKQGNIPRLKEFLILAGKSGIRNLHPERIPKSEWDPEYRWVVVGPTRRDIRHLKLIIADSARTPEDVKRADTICQSFRLFPLATVCQEERNTNPTKDWLTINSWRIVRTCSTSRTAKQRADVKRSQIPNKNGAFTIETAQRKLYVIVVRYDKTKTQPRMKLLFADDYLTVHPGDFWSDIKTTNLADEGGVSFVKGKKPEALLKRIIGMTTSPGDWVLDAYAGSGTSGAVAHKMRRQWLMIEDGAQCESHIVPRLRSVIGGTDDSGTTKILGWQGGGGFRFFRSPS